MRRSAVLLTLIALLAVALPALAQEDPLAEAVLLPNVVGWGLVALAVVLVILFRLWSSRGPR